jgi:WhiB family transcriptional regulator, redox-sensing transcriptional regulator
VTVTIDKPLPVTTPPCLSDPDRWAAGGEDQELKALCRACSRRWLCAKEALKTPGAEGMWSGVNIPEDGRGRKFAFVQLRSLAAHGGYHAADTA